MRTFEELAALFYMIGAYALFMMTVGLIIVAVHEFGHWLAGRLLGFRWTQVIIGPLAIHWTGHRPSYSYSKKLRGGMVYLVPIHLRHYAMRQTIVLLAGFLGNFLFTVLLIAIYLALPSSMHSGSWPLFAIGFLSVFVGAANLLPFVTEGQNSDGMNLLSLWCQRKSWQPGNQFYERVDHWRKATLTALDRQEALVTLYLWLGGKRPMPSGTVLERAIERDGTAQEAFARHYAFYWTEAREDIATSGLHIERAMDILGQIKEKDRVWFIFDAAYHKGFHRGESEEARKLLEQGISICPARTKKRYEYRVSSLRAEAAILFAEGKRQEASEKARRAISQLKRQDDVLKVMLKRMIAECEVDARPAEA